MIIFKKIWNDPVWSKVIATFIVAIFPVVLLWNYVIEIVSLVFSFIFTNWSYSLNILLFTILVIFILLSVKKRKKNRSLKWLKNNMNTHLDKYMFLFWFPINGTLIGNYNGIPIDIVSNINHTKMINDLLRNEVISFDTRFIARISMNEKTYEYLESKLKKDPTNAKKLINLLKDKEFKDVVYNLVYLQKGMT